MENSLAYKWVAILFFSVVGIMFTASVVYLASGKVAPDTFFGRKMTLTPTAKVASSTTVDKHVLELDKAKQIGKRIFFYRGRQGDQIHLDVIIPELDRQYPYPFKVNLKKAKDGFEVAGIWLRLLSVRPQFVSVKAKRLG